MNLLTLLKESIKHVPDNKYAIGVVGIVAAAAIALEFASNDPILTLGGSIGVFLGMVVLRIFTSDPPTQSRTPQFIVLTWFCLVAFIGVTLLLLGRLGLVVFGGGSLSAKATAITPLPTDSTSRLLIEQVRFVGWPREGSNNYSVDTEFLNNGKPARITRVVCSVENSWKLERIDHDKLIGVCPETPLRLRNDKTPYEFDFPIDKRITKMGVISLPVDVATVGTSDEDHVVKFTLTFFWDGGEPVSTPPLFYIRPMQRRYRYTSALAEIGLETGIKCDAVKYMLLSSVD